MLDKKIKVDNIEFVLADGQSFEFTGVHARRELSGIDLDVTVSTQIEIQQIEELLKKKTVVVIDPFVGRQYESVLTQSSYSYQEGLPDRRFRFKVKELDKAKRFDELEIEGHFFHVLNNAEDLHDGKIGMHMLLRLSPDEFLRLRSLLKAGPVEIQRIGIDENPITRRFGGAQYWSLHTDDSQKFYKHIVRFFPLGLPGTKLNIASGHEQNAHSEMLLALSARFETLVKMLAENNQIAQECSTSLLNDPWSGLIDDERKLILDSKFTRIKDAETEFHRK